ncbi:mobilization protein [Streptacidiphilus sp. MAP5-52]|uniref:relaxase/mobilization nuclease domain-containing protein n=1 Tax=Streptacidiphilus sp. MAP5-52 TaxID=3156267 RepID=UPI0035197BAE
MVPNIIRGSSTYGVLKYLYGAGLKDEHEDPHLIGSWDGFAPDPGRSATATLQHLAQVLDLRVNQRGSRHRPARHVWHCPVRAAPGDRQLTDDEWGEVARRVVTAAGLVKTGDPDSCRWIAVRHADDHIHIVATTVRGDLRVAKLDQDARRVQTECRKIEEEWGLQRLNAGDKTAAKRPTHAEANKATRLGRKEPFRLGVRDKVRQAVAGAADEDEFFDRLTAAGLLIKKRLAPSGDLLGYAVADPDDVNGRGAPVYYSGSKLAPDLSLPRIRHRLTGGLPTAYPDQETGDRSTGRSRIPGSKAALARRRATGAAEDATHILEEGDEQEAAAVLVGTIEIIDILAQRSPADTQRQMLAAARSFERASRSHTRAAQGDRAAVRTAARELLRSGYATHRGEDGGVTAMLLSTLVLLAIAAGRWHAARGHDQQAAAAYESATWLRESYTLVAAPPMATMNRSGKALPAQVRERHARTVREHLPEGEHLLREYNWDALAATLAEAEAAGHDPAELLKRARSRRELETAESVTAVMVWRIRRLADLPAAPVATPAQPTDTRTSRRGPTDGPAAAPPRRPAR